MAFDPDEPLENYSPEELARGKLYLQKAHLDLQHAVVRICESGISPLFVAAAMGDILAQIIQGAPSREGIKMCIDSFESYFNKGLISKLPDGAGAFDGDAHLNVTVVDEPNHYHKGTTT